MDLTTRKERSEQTNSASYDSTCLISFIESKVSVSDNILLISFLPFFYMHGVWVHSKR